MGDETRITWADHTFNGWIGCEHMAHTDLNGQEFIAPECLQCYAERQDKFYKWNGGTWGPDAPRTITSIPNWHKPFLWDAAARRLGVRRRAFAFSLADVWDDKAPKWDIARPIEIPKDDFTANGGTVRWLRKPAPTSWTAPEYPLWLMGECLTARDIFLTDIVQRTGQLDWLLLTKRFYQSVSGYRQLWGDAAWPNVWTIFSAGVQKTLDQVAIAMWPGAQSPFARKRGWNLNSVVRGVSAEPLLGPMDFSIVLGSQCSHPGDEKCYRCPLPLNWVIIGGESGGLTARPMHIQWVRRILAHCRETSTPVFFKQWGEWLPLSQVEFLPEDVRDRLLYTKRAWGVLDPTTGRFNKRDEVDWVAPSRIAEKLSFGALLDGVMIYAGVDNAGDLIDGKRIWEFPEVSHA